MKITIELPPEGARLLLALSEITGASPAAISETTLTFILGSWDLRDCLAEDLFRICSLCGELNLPKNDAMNRACEMAFSEEGDLQAAFANLDESDLEAFALWVNCYGFQSADYARELGRELVAAMSAQEKSTTFASIVAARPDGLWGVRICEGTE